MGSGEITNYSISRAEGVYAINGDFNGNGTSDLVTVSQTGATLSVACSYDDNTSRIRQSQSVVHNDGRIWSLSSVTAQAGKVQVYMELLGRNSSESGQRTITFDLQDPITIKSQDSAQIGDAPLPAPTSIGSPNSGTEAPVATSNRMIYSPTTGSLPGLEPRAARPAPAQPAPPDPEPKAPASGTIIYTPATGNLPGLAPRTTATPAPTSAPKAQDTAPITDDDSVQAAPLNTAAAPGRVIEITDANFNSQVWNQAVPVIVDFNAAWCGPCKEMKPIFAQLAAEYKGKIKFCSVGTDVSPNAARKLGISVIPTFMFVASGSSTPTTGFQGAVTIDQFRKAIEKSFNL